MNSIAQYAKAITGAIAAGLTAVISAYGPNSDAGKIAAIVLAVVISAGAVWAIPNKPPGASILDVINKPDPAP